MLDFDIKLDGTSIRDRIEKTTIIYDRNATHNSIKIETSDRGLWNEIEPDESGTARITAVIGTDEIPFLLEGPKNGSESRFSFGGRSLSATETGDYANNINITLEDNEYAKTVALGFVTRPLIWEINEWLWLPRGYSYSGSPIDGVRNIAEVFGAIVRSNDAGDIVVTKHMKGIFPPYNKTVYPADPADYIIDISDDVIEEISYEETDGKCYNAVIISAVNTAEIPEIEVEPGNLIQGQPAYLRVYWPKRMQNQTPIFYTTEGSVSLDTSGNFEHEETVVFQDGSGHTSHNIASISSVEWIGAACGPIEWDEGEKEIRIPQIGGIAKIKYYAHYQRYEINNVNAEQVLIGFSPIPQDAPKKCQIGSGEIVAPKINEPNLADDNGKRSRANTVLAESSNIKRLKMRMPMIYKMRDGNIAEISESVFSLSGKFMIERITMNIEEVKMVYEIDLIQYHRE